MSARGLGCVDIWGKILVDALGNPLDFGLTGGQVNDITQGPALVRGRESDDVITDKSYDAEPFIELIEAQGAIAVILPRRNRKERRWYDPAVYKERHAVECFVNKIKWHILMETAEKVRVVE